MSAQLQYCTSLQFHERCKKADPEALGDDTYFRSRVEQALQQCLIKDDNNSLGSTAKLHSALTVIDWKSLFSNHNAHHAGRDVTAMTGVLAALSNTLSEPHHDELSKVLFFQSWAFCRQTSKNSTVWLPSDIFMFNFLGTGVLSANNSYNHNSAAVLNLVSIANTCAARVSCGIESTFTIGPNSCNQDNGDATRLRKEQASQATSLVLLLKDLNQATEREFDCSHAMLLMLKTLDDTDIKNLQLLETLNRSNKRNKHALAISSSKKRQRLPSGTRSSDIVQAMHNTSLDLGDDRHQRAKRAQYEHQSGMTMQVSLKQVLTAPSTTKDDRSQTAGEATNESNNRLDGILEAYNQSRISTLTAEATYLRRDLYLCLVEQDRNNIEKRCGVGKDQERIVESKLTQLVSSLFSRLKQFNSPSIRLYTIMTLDHLRELNLGDKGYLLLMDRLYLQDDDRKDKKAIYLKMFTEIVSECNAFASPRRLVAALSNLVKIALTPHLIGRHKWMLRAVGHILLRRKHILSQLDGDEKKAYHNLTVKLSIEFDDPLYWISQDRTRRENEELVAVLKSCGILSLMHTYNFEDVDAHSRHSDYTSLRSTHTRLGPCQGFNKMLTSSSQYEYICEVKPPARVTVDTTERRSPLSNMDHNGVLHVVFDFLGYRSLSRASMCCKAWRSAACSNSRWCRLYFHKFKGALLEEELDVFNFFNFYPRWAHDLDQRIIYLMSREGYDWFIIFKHNYIAEKFARRHAVGTKWNRVCPFVGCNMCIVSEHRWNTHRNNHVKQWHARIKKKDTLQALRVKASKLKQALSPGLEYSNAVKLPGRKKSKIETPESVLNIVFVFLDIKDLNRVRSVCKLWTERSNSLWYEVYCRYFGEPNVKWISAPRYQCNWKRLFDAKYRTKQYLMQCGETTNLGCRIQICSVLGCRATLQSKLDLDLHLVGHEIRWLEEVSRKRRGGTSSTKKRTLRSS
ncbi:hypothetical protein ACHAWO_002021 [Cyclotella atomus]|uniref:F-box domain-containing protein n=1 Tax=Cyclotella atomus TaxID=382360 RepID=A0ABD3PQ60_9STRA